MGEASASTSRLSRLGRLWRLCQSQYAYTGVARRTRWGADRLARYQRAALHDTLVYAARQVPFHSERAPKDPTDLGSWPINSRGELKSIPVETLLAVGVSPGDCHVLTTSGTTGEPLRMYYNMADLRERWLYFQRMLRAYGLPVFCRLANVGSYRTSRVYDPTSGWQLDRRSFLSVYEPVDRRLDQLCRADPQAIMGYTSDLAEMADRARTRGLIFPSLKVVIGVGEQMDAARRRAIQIGFGVTVRDSYGAVETGSIAFECPGGCGLYHLQADNLFVEILNDGRPAPPGTAGDVVITHLHYRAMPLIRYRLGDIAARAGACGCGLHLPTLAQPEGRADDALTLSSGRRLTPQAINCVFCCHHEIRSYRVRQQRRGVFTLEVDVPDMEMARSLGEQLGRLLDEDDQLTVERCGLLPASGRGQSVVAVDGQ